MKKKLSEEETSFMYTRKIQGGGSIKRILRYSYFLRIQAFLLFFCAALSFKEGRENGDKENKEKGKRDLRKQREGKEISKEIKRRESNKRS